jgi:uroporphyrin-III C-methyltransferase/precorrin-2 dehydrogenase/sirohydrochlorin ferrochelatase
MRNLFPLAPIFLDLAGRSVLFLNGDAPLARLARSMLDCGAGITIIDAAPDGAFEALAPPARIVRRRWRAADFKGAALVIAGAGERRAQQAKASAKAARAFFYMAEAPELSDLAFGAIHTTEALAIGVSTPAAPGAVQDVVREKLAGTVPARFQGFVAAAADASGAVNRIMADADAQTRFWHEAANAAFEARPRDWRAWIIARAEKAAAGQRRATRKKH